MIEIEINNVRSKIIGEVPDEILKSIDMATSYEIPGAFYARKYNRFAGTVKLFSPYSQSFPTGLIHYVVDALKKAGISCHLRDNRPQVQIGSEMKVKGIVFRDYQNEAINEAIKKQRGIVKIGTGGGKTNVFIGVVAKLNVPTLILIHKTDVFYQIISRLEAALGIHIGRIGDEVKDIQPITVGMVQSIAACYNFGREREEKDENGNAKTIFLPDAPETVAEKQKVQDYVKSVNCLITDECHHVPSDSFSMIHKKAENAFYKIGMSASPWREDNADLLIEAWQGKIIVDISASKLIDAGYLVPPLVQMFLFKHPRKGRDKMRYPDIYDIEVVHNTERNKVIAQAALKAISAGKTVLIAVTKVEHGKILEAMLQQFDPTAIFVFGESESQLRQDVLKELDERKRKIVICTTIFGEGIDVPNLDVLINAKAAASSVDAFQLIGRVLRKPYNKVKAYIVDIFDQNCKFLESHANDREKIYKTESRYKMQDVNSVDDLIFDDGSW
jgi:superfamily II DNA or RNA helicase